MTREELHQAAVEIEKRIDAESKELRKTVVQKYQQELDILHQECHNNGRHDMWTGIRHSDGFICINCWVEMSYEEYKEYHNKYLKDKTPEDE